MPRGNWRRIDTNDQRGQVLNFDVVSTLHQNSRPDPFRGRRIMPKEVIMPQMGESVVEGTILRWLIQEGQRVEKDQSLVEISTDKVDTEIPSPVAGLVTKILRHADETVPVGTVIVLIEEGVEGVKAPQAPEIPPAGLPAKERHEEIAEQKPD